MNALLQIFLFSAVVAVALCAVPRAEDVEVVAAAARTVVKMHKLHQQGLVSQEDLHSACTAADKVLQYCQIIPGLGDVCKGASSACHGVAQVVDIGAGIFSGIKDLFG